MTSRRAFLGGSVAGVLGTSLFSRVGAVGRAAKPLDILVLGGTGFIGPHEVNRMLDRGHKVTLFNRGRRQGQFGGRVEELTGDRDAKVGDGLKALEGSRRWDVVVDNSGYIPRHVRDSAQLLRNRCDQYLYISTVAVYDTDGEPGESRILTNQSALWSDVPDTEEVNGKTYGPLKAECDRVVLDVAGDKATLVRPTYVVGPGDSTDRFTYWVDRINRGGDVLAPAGPGYEAQWIDVRDLTTFVVELAESRTFGTFNTAGPRSEVTNEGLMWGLRAMSSAPVRFHWPSAELLESMSLQLPMMAARDWSRHIDSTAALDAGLGMRSLAESAMDIQAWWDAQSADRKAAARRWPTPEQEREAIRRIKG